VEEVHPKVECDGSSTLEFEVVLLVWRISAISPGFLAIMARSSIYTPMHVFICIAIGMHPDISFGLGGSKPHMSETIKKNIHAKNAVWKNSKGHKVPQR
jgi:hypothetical protein